MAQSAKERMKNYRRHIKEDSEKKELLAEKDRLRKAEQRRGKKELLTDSQKSSIREYEREKKRQQRARKKATVQANQHRTPTCTSSETAYTNPSSLGKAVCRAKRSMPSCPVKQARVVGSMINAMTPTKRKLVAEQVNSTKSKRTLYSEPRSKRSDSISEDDIQQVVEFYECDDASRMCPGKKECVSIRVDGKRERRQKKLLLMNLKEAHQLFLREHDINISLSKFCELRSPHVVPITTRDQDVCICKYHENIDLLLSGVKKVVHDIPSTADDIVKLTVCSMDSTDCINRMCDECSIQNLDHYFEDFDDETAIDYFQWTSGDTGVITKLLVHDVLRDVRDKLYVQLGSFSRHAYNVKRQHYELKTLKDNLAPGEVIIQEDFAENYLLKHQREIMQAHWSSDSVSIFTAVAYVRLSPAEDLSHSSFGIISEELSHDKNMVYTCNKVILDTLKEELPWPIETVHYWSDGAASQFKNKFNFGNLLLHEADHGCKADWSFFATAHGKGPVDGIGGEIKRQVWRSELQGKTVVQDAESFAAIASNLCPKVTIKYVSKNQIINITNHLSARYDTFRPLPGTQSYHFIKPVNEQVLAYGQNSIFSCLSAPLLTHTLRMANEEDASPTNVPADDSQVEQSTPAPPTDSPQHVKYGDFVRVCLEGLRKSNFFIGQVLRTVDDGFEVSFLRATNKTMRIFVHPPIEDKAHVTKDEVVCALPVPSMDARGRYQFADPVNVSQ